MSWGADSTQDRSLVSAGVSHPTRVDRQYLSWPGLSPAPITVNDRRERHGQGDSGSRHLEDRTAQISPRALWTKCWSCPTWGSLTTGDNISSNSSQRVSKPNTAGHCCYMPGM
ncbi:hypothetical protein RRG08_043491 [Elysia crispata]|uniref:Uncharacterized protein n=1 Tax=Elysia crispata TaxID=231223 RepID=A0AAE1CXV2_9GAST|nr:hypothetical protein RRG08_043491 [Elysia crispata]